MKFQKTISNWLENRYLLIVRNEENFAEKTTFSFTYAKMILLGVIVFLTLMSISFFLIKTLLAQWFDPKHAQIQANRELYQLHEKVDSLANEVEMKDQFILNFQRVLIGDTTKISENVIENFERSLNNQSDTIDIKKITTIDSQFRKEYEKTDLSLMNIGNEVYNQLQELYLFSPISGYVTAPYNVKAGHFGVDVVAKKNEAVKCVADGSVLIASWTQDSGYVIVVQHRGNLLSVYKHNSELLKKVGSFVSAGEIISIIGNTGELTDGPHLHFELWYNGNSVNPEEFVNF